MNRTIEFAQVSNKQRLGVYFLSVQYTFQNSELYHVNTVSAGLDSLLIQKIFLMIISSTLRTRKTA